VKRSLILFGTTLLLLSVTAALGDPLVMQCNKANCVRSRCDEWGENCRPAGYFRLSKGQYAVPQSKQVCNEFGDCHFAPPSFPPIAASKAPAAAAPAAAAVPAPAAVTPAPLAVAPVPAPVVPPTPTIVPK
jgi:hypothetical protein